MKPVVVMVLFLIFSVSTSPQSGMSAKKAKAAIDAKITAKVATVDEIDGITLRLKEATVFLAYDNCENARKKHWLQNWLKYRYDPCKVELQRIELSLN